MDNFRVYGNPAYKVFLLHGGSGGAGELAPVARKLSEKQGLSKRLRQKIQLPDN
jgi:hypothetical protein